MQNFVTFIIIGSIFSPFAGLMAGFITYEEWKHHYSDNKQPMREAINTGIFAFLVFFGITVLVGFLLGYVITP